MRILIMGLPGSGKTTLAARLFAELLIQDNPTVWFNGNDVREEHDDWDFSPEGRMRQAVRMRNYADNYKYHHVICDFVAPLQEMRNVFDPDYIIWMNTVYSCQYEDTNKIFQIPDNVDFEITELDHEKWVPAILDDIKEKMKCLV